MVKGKFSEFIFGRIHFRVSEGFAGEFLAECRKQQIIISGLEKEDDFFYGYINYSDKENLLIAAGRSGMKIEILERRGLPDILIRYRRRYGIPAGILVFVMISAVLYSVLWTIDITETENIPREKIEEILGEAGIRTGVFSDTVNCKDVEYELYKALPEISWVNVHIIGTRMYVDIREVDVQEQIKPEQYSNIIAKKDGEVINAEIFKGDGKIYPGTAVVKGDLLVGGIINHRDGSVKFVDSEAKIFARTDSFILSRIPRTVSVKTMSKCKEYFFPEFFGISIASLNNVKSDNFTINKSFISDRDVVIPVGIARKFTYSFAEAEMQMTDAEALLLCFRDFAVSALKLYKNAEILESDITVDLSKGAEISGDFLTIEDIALKKTFTVEDR